MSAWDAQQVLEVMLQADGGCSNCVHNLFVDFIAVYPKFTELAKTTFETAFSKGEWEELL